MGNFLSHTLTLIGFLPTGYAGNGYPLPSLISAGTLAFHECLKDLSDLYIRQLLIYEFDHEFAILNLHPPWHVLILIKNHTIQHRAHNVHLILLSDI